MNTGWLSYDTDCGGDWADKKVRYVLCGMTVQRYFPHLKKGGQIKLHTKRAWRKRPFLNHVKMHVPRNDWIVKVYRDGQWHWHGTYPQFRKKLWPGTYWVWVEQRS